MATEGIIYGARKGTQGPRLELYWYVESQDIAANTSYVRVSTWVNFESPPSWSGYNRTGSTTVDGDTSSYSNTSSGYNELDRRVAIQYFTVKHNADGTASIPISGSFNINIDWSGYGYITTISASGTAVLPSITRGITNISYASGFTYLTGSKSITFTKQNTSVVVELALRYYLPLEGKDSEWFTIFTSMSSGQTFSFDQSLIDKVHADRPNGTEATVEFRLRSILNGSIIDTNYRTINFKLSTTQPNVGGSFKVTGMNVAIIGGTNRGIAGVHSVEVTPSGSGVDGSTISYYIVEFAGVKKQISSGTATIPIPVGETDKNVYVTAVDSRGGSKRISIGAVTLLAYSQPTLSNLLATRTKDGVNNPVGPNVLIKGTVVYSNVYNLSGTQINKPFWKIDSGTESNTASIYYTAALPIEQEKTYSIYYGDSFTSTYKKIVVNITVGQAPLTIGKNCIGVGVVPPANGQGLYLDPVMVNDKPLYPLADDFSNKCIINSIAVTKLVAIKVGNCITVSFTYKPEAEGFNASIITLPNGYGPLQRVSGNVDYSGSYDVRDSNISCYIIDKDIGVVARPIPANNCYFSFTYVTNY